METTEILMLKKKLNRKLLLEYNLISKTDYAELVEVIDNSLINLAPNMVGIENGLSYAELLLNIFKVELKELNSYQLITFISILRSRIHKLRAQEIAFFLKKGSKVFVLQTQKEADEYKNLLKRDIEAFKKSMIKADEWVQQRKYLNMKSFKSIEGF